MEQAKQLLHSYLRVTRYMSRQFRNYFGELELTLPQTMVLAVLGEEGVMPISRLAQYIGSANSTVSGVVDRLERLNLVERVRSEEDRRVVYVGLTRECLARQEQKEPCVSAYLSKVLRELRGQELDAICAALDKLDKALERAGEQS